jgi:putative DNA primase/helicase
VRTVIAATDRPSILDSFDSGFLQLTINKAPINWTLYPARRIDAWENIGLQIPDGYIAIDVDIANEAEKLTELLRSERVPCQIMQTTRGRHFWFKAHEPVKNSVKSMTGIGVTCDYRSWGKKSQVCVKFNGQWRAWLTNEPWDRIAELPKWLRPLCQNKWRFTGMRDGDGRNQALFEYQVDLAKRGYSHAEARELLRLINRYIFDQPLEDKEMEVILREDAYPSVDNDSGKGAEKPKKKNKNPMGLPFLTEDGQFLHEVLAAIIAKDIHALSLNGRLYYYADGYYKDAELRISKAVLERFPHATEKQRREVREWLRVHCDIERPALDEYVVNCKNGRLNLQTGELTPHDPKYHDFQQINARYDPTVHCDALDSMISRVFRDDWSLCKLFDEMLACCLWKNQRMQTIFVFHGEGSNGKSTLLRVIKTFIGKGNYSTLSMQDFETPFMPAELEHKLVNLGDDVPSTEIRDSSMLKSLSSGETVTAQRKFRDPFDLDNYATMIFTTNEVPRARDTTFGFHRRLKLIPLYAVFTKDDEDYDPDISKKLTSETAMTCMLSMATRGTKRIMKNKGFTQSKVVDEASESYREYNSIVVKWLNDTAITTEELCAVSTGELYFRFKAWCDNEGIKNVPTHTKFTRDIGRERGLTRGTQERDKATGKPIRRLVPRLTGNIGDDL